MAEEAPPLTAEEYDALLDAAKPANVKDEVDNVDEAGEEGAASMEQSK